MGIAAALYRRILHFSHLLKNNNVAIIIIDHLGIVKLFTYNMLKHQHFPRL